jgi:hypothetical protein
MMLGYPAWRPFVTNTFWKQLYKVYLMNLCLALEDIRNLLTYVMHLTCGQHLLEGCDGCQSLFAYSRAYRLHFLSVVRGHGETSFIVYERVA